ncbi:MAG: ABC transporter permease [Planctomycetes bacterium]|nr:ABC transporter permease [Planctomycetota bacterium]
MNPLRARLATIAAAGKLGWAMESNWADPFLFAVYFLVRPIATTLILVVMYKVVTDGRTGTPFFAALYIGNAFFQYVGQVLFGVSSAVQEDREHYQMLKYIWSAPVSTLDYLIGRGLTKMATGTVAVLVTLAFGWVFLGVSFDAGVVRPLLALAALALGLALLVFLGLAFAGIELNRTHGQAPLQEGAAGVLYLCSGAIFPPEVMPGPLAALCYALPTTWWIEALRRALLGHGWCGALSNWSDGAILGVLALQVTLFAAPCVWLYKVLDRRARRKNLIDWTTGF